MSEFPNIEKLREAVSSEGRVVDHLCDSFSNHTWVRLNLVNPIRRAFGAARFLLSLLDEGGRLVVEAPCEHGIHDVHPFPGKRIGDLPYCPGGSRRVVWPKEEA